MNIFTRKQYKIKNTLFILRRFISSSPYENNWKRNIQPDTVSIKKPRTRYWGKSPNECDFKSSISSSPI